MTPIYDQLLWEHLDRKDTTFESFHTTQTVVDSIVPGLGKRTAIVHSIEIRQKEMVAWARPMLASCIHTSETPSPASETVKSYGGMWARVSRLSPRPTTSRRKPQSLFTSSPPQRSEIALTGRENLLSTA